jgi:hypothetical protein
MAAFHKSISRMSKTKPHQSGFFRQFIGWVALCLLLLINFKAAAFSTALWLVDLHGHDHHVTVQSDGNHLDVSLSHDHEDDQPTEDTDHVLHFDLNETPDQISQRNVVNTTPTFAPSVAIAAFNSTYSPSIPTQSASVVPPESPPPLTAGLLGLRTTVLLV